MLHDVEEDRGHAFLQALGRLEGYAIDKHGAPFVKLSEARRTAILESLDGAEDPKLKTGAEFFKRLTVEGYHTWKIDIDELNKDGVPATFACTHASHG